MECYDLVARWPGSTHDSFIYNSSASKQRLNTGVLKGIILGDSGYAVSNVLLTPFLSPNSTAQENYNRSQIKYNVEYCGKMLWHLEKKVSLSPTWHGH